LILGTSAAIALVAALVFGGAAAPLLIGDPGDVIRWSLPVARLINNLSAALMIGPMVLALFALRAGEKPFEIAMDTASIGAAVFTVSSAATAFLTFLAAFNPQVSLEQQFGEQLGRFLLALPLGQAWLITTILGALVTILAFAWRSWTPTLITAIIALRSEERRVGKGGS